MSNKAQNPKQKIAHVVCSFPPNKDGTANSAYEIVKHLSKIGHNITVFTPAKKVVIARSEERTTKQSRGLISMFFKNNAAIHEIASLTARNDNDKNLKVKRLKPLFSIGNASFLPQLVWQLLKFDIVHLHYPFYGAAEFVVLAKILKPKIKLIIHYHQDAVGSGAKKLIFKFYQFFVLPILVRLSHAITCATIDYIKVSELGSYYKKQPEKFKQTYFGIDTSKFTPSITKDGAGDSKTILFVGGLDKAHYFKGVDILLQAVAKLKYPNWKLEIVGDGDLRPQYEKLSQKLGIQEKVKFWGKIDDKKLILCYNNCNIFVLPSINKTEAFGLVLLEAMSFAKPVIASNLPGVSSVFEDGKQGYFVKPSDADDLAEKIELLLNNDKLAIEMGNKGQKLVKEKYSWDKVVERIEKVYSLHNT